MTSAVRIVLVEHPSQVGAGDVVVDLASGDYPRVIDLLVRLRGKRASTLGWDEVLTINWQDRRIIVRDLEAGREPASGDLVRSVLAGRDVLDALIVDVADRQTMRANCGSARRTVNCSWRELMPARGQSFAVQVEGYLAVDAIAG